ncbi:acetyl-CoA acetyltransferase [Desulforamulus reducens MI-1]|uniref:Acetyl-CoA acetyltransferase n=1 Tax=Desulforamulus reducens (strain ATCC BAA-1160 / DSM 100696 / MI-1) TaxID=349161 RepID=A4J4L8_DESRM|nr:acetyl-CoA C-acetyltransferase [Desulforamulus reducens]ABO50021.1 acetyl-CoA acetyltransferase [Desulforamulus reducens MI-1]
MRNVVIVGAARTPIGDYLGSLKDISAVDLGVTAVTGALNKAGLKPEQVNEVLIGMCMQGAAKGNPARQVQLNSKIPVEAPAATINQQCGSAMRATEIAAQQIMLGKEDVIVAGGIESMSKAPYYLLNVREGLRMGDGKVYDALTYDGLNDAFYGYHMGITTENLVEKYNISRQEQDELAILSHQRSTAAIQAGKFKEEIIPVEIKTRKGTKIVDTDEHPRSDISIEKLASLKAVFKKDGTVTAGNASGINDGAAALVLMAEDKAKELGIKPLARILNTASFGVDPSIMGIGPVYAIPKALNFVNLKLSDIDLFELNEAFAGQFLACNRELKIPMDKVNINGSGISLGHPVGATGVRIIVSLIYEMKRQGSRLGVASLCCGGGPGIAAVIENID